MILMNLRDRMFEIGILLSVGETKMRIMLQMLMESFCPVLLAITAGVIFSYPLANVIKIAVDLSNGVQAAIKTQQIIILYLCGMGVGAGFFYGYGIPDCTISAEKDFDDGVKKEIVR